jgi:hypothetical protein
VLPIYLVVDARITPQHPVGEAVEAFVDRGHALKFIEMAYEENHPDAHHLRIEGERNPLAGAERRTSDCTIAPVPLPPTANRCRARLLKRRWPDRWHFSWRARVYLIRESRGRRYFFPNALATSSDVVQYPSFAAIGLGV